MNKKTKKPVVGEKMRTWFSGEESGESTILEVTPYTGLYKQWFTYWVKLSVKVKPGQYGNRGWAIMAV
jgi:hypothetical protein